jgi:hypothetical protein
LKPFLDSLVQFFAYLIVVVPIAILIAGVILYFLFPHQRLTTGIIFTSLRSAGLLIFLDVLNIEIARGKIETGIILLVLVELTTIIFGLISLLSSRIQSKKQIIA